MTARLVAEINERRRVLRAEDHDVPYAPAPSIPIVHTMGPRVAQAAMLRLVDALNAAGNRPVMVLGAPLRILMPVDRNPFPRFRPFRWLP